MGFAGKYRADGRVPMDRDPRPAPGQTPPV